MKLNPLVQEILTQTPINHNLLVLLVGRSGSGKTELEKNLVNCAGFQGVKSYTTRPKRSLNEDNHIFIDTEEFHSLENKVAYTHFNGYEYCATKEQLDEAQIYVIDPDGVEYLKNCYNGKKFVIVYLDADSDTCWERMIGRGDDYYTIHSRLWNDNDVFAKFKEKADFTINANQSAEEVFQDFLNLYKLIYMNDLIDEMGKEVKLWKESSQRLP